MTPPEAVAGAFERHRARVEAVAARILGDREEARDVASETFLALFEKGPADPDDALPWLLTASRNRALNRVRDRGRAWRKEQRAADRPVEDDLALDDAAADLVRRALDRLPDRDRVAVIMRYLEEASYEEIARALSTSSAQARVVVHRAARKLRATTVDLLAEHHHASNSCKRRLQLGVRTHPGCAPCASVVDEVRSLGALGLLPAVGTPRGAARFMRIRSHHDSPRFAEAVAVVLVTGALAVSNSAPVANIATTSTRSQRASTARFEHRVAEKRVARSEGSVTKMTTALKHVVRFTDAPHDTTLDPGESLRVLGIPFALPDAPDTQLDPGVDIRQFEIATLASADRAQALLLRFKLAGPLPNGSAFSVVWSFENGCSGDASFTHNAGNQQLGGQSYPEEAVTSIGCFNALALPTDPPNSTNLATDIRRPAVDVVELVVHFSDSDRFARMLSGGALMKAVDAMTQLGLTNQDYAPNAQGFDYRIEK